METQALRSMSIDELWNFHEQLVGELSRRIAAEKTRLEDRLRKLGSAPVGKKGGVERRPYPKVHAKYRNPKNPAETWAGRGYKPRWLKAQLRAGKKVDDFLIKRS